GKAEGAACGACSCGPLEGTVCVAPGISCDYDSTDCANAVPRPELDDGNCHDLPGGDVSCFLNDNDPLSSPGSCTPSPEVPDFPNKLPFTDVFDACHFDTTTTAVGCDGTDLCIPPGSGSYAGGLCVMFADDQVPCPPGWDAKDPIRLYKQEDVFDGRGCEPCTCAPDLAALQCNGSHYEVWDLDDCNDCDFACDDETSVNSTTCKDLSKWADSNTLSIKLRRAQPEHGKCIVGGGASTGFVETSKGVTFCCLP
ncbi:MAG: hypothetical protein ACOC1F_04685, partial [Myxococcota bacterium]